MAGTDTTESKDVGHAAGDTIADILTAAGFLLFSILMFIGATRFSYQEEMGFVTSAGFTPMLLGVLVGVLSIILIIKTIRANKLVSLRISAWFTDNRRNETVRRSLVIILITGLYIFAVGHLPFLPLTFVFLCSIYFYLKVGSLIKIIIYSLANSLLIAYAIPWVYQMPLP